MKGLNTAIFVAGVSLIIYYYVVHSTSEPSVSSYEKVTQPFSRSASQTPGAMQEEPKKISVATPLKTIETPPPQQLDRGGAPQWPKGVVEFEIVDGKYAVGFGDIILGLVPEDKRHLKRAYFEPPRSRLWPSAEIPFSIEENTPNKGQIMAAIEHFHAETPIRFVPISEQEDSVIFMAAENLCASQVGHTGGHQVILISPECSRNEIIHEILHTLGFIHEHSREDRDRFIEVLWSNIDPKFYLQFQMAPDSWAQEYRGSVFDFDPKSIMLYPPNLFAKQPGLETLRPKSGAALEPSKNGLSRIDKERVYYLYGQ